MAANVSNVGCFKLPNEKGLSSGVDTASLIQVLYASNTSSGDRYVSWLILFCLMRHSFRRKIDDQIPQSYFRLMDFDEPFSSINHCYKVFVGINYISKI